MFFNNDNFPNYNQYQYEQEQNRRRQYEWEKTLSREAGRRDGPTGIFRPNNTFSIDAYSKGFDETYLPRCNHGVPIGKVCPACRNIKPF